VIKSDRRHHSCDTRQRHTALMTLNCQSLCFQLQSAIDVRLISIDVFDKHHSPSGRLDVSEFLRLKIDTSKANSRVLEAAHRGCSAFQRVKIWLMLSENFRELPQTGPEK